MPVLCAHRRRSLPLLLLHTIGLRSLQRSFSISADFATVEMGSRVRPHVSFSTLYTLTQYEIKLIAFHSVSVFRCMPLQEALTIYTRVDVRIATTHFLTFALAVTRAV